MRITTLLRGVSLAALASSSLASVTSIRPEAAQPSTVSKVDPCNAKLYKSTTTPEAALECLRNIPFSKTEALDLIDNMRIFTHFVPSQAYYTTDTLPWLELPVFNVNKSIGEIEERAKSGYYKNGYDFWHAIELVYTNFRDGHMAFRPTCGGFAFLYFHEHGIVSVGTESGGDREIWTVEESKNSTVPKLLKQIAKINGLAAVDYLLDLANYLPELTYLDPDTRWNALMSEWPSGRTSNRFRSRSYWRGAEAEKLVLEYADGTKLNIKWKANFQRSKFPEFDSTDSLVKKICYASDKYVALWAPSASAEEVKKNPRGAKYKELKSATQLSYIKLQTDEQEDATGSKGISEEDATKSKDISEEDATAASGAFTPRTTPLYGYPEPEDRGPNDALVWYLDPDDETVAILHIPTFGVTDIDPWESFFHSTLEGLHSNGIKKLIVDVSGNGGGNAILGKRSTRMFFPEDFNGEGEPDQYAQLRYHPALSKIMRGEVDDKFAKEDFFDEDKFSSLKNENMTLDELLGPYTNKRVNDYFTAMSLYKRDIVTAEDFTNYFDHKNYWKKEDVIIVTNSRCSSTCHNFVELMGQVGVRSFAFGGRPGYEAMQSVGGTKGGNRFDYERLVLEIYAGLGDVSNDNDMPLPLRTNLGTAINGIENKYRNSDHDINYSLPLFFTWTPACKKLPITKAMATNVQEIWRAAKKAAWVDGKATECDDWINDKLTGTLPVEIKDVDASNEESVPVEENTETADSSSDNSGELVNNISDSISLSRLSEEDNIVGETIWRVMRGGSEDAIYGHDVDGTEATDEDQDSTPSIFLAEPPRWR